MKIKALVPFSNGTISMEQYEVRDLPDALAQNLIDAGIVVEIGGGGLPPVTASDAGKVLAVDNSGVWGASVNQVEIFADYDPATGFFTQRSGADVPTANELKTAFSCNGTVRMRIFVNDNEVGAAYLYPFDNELNGSMLFGTVVRNVSADYDDSINVMFSVNDDDEVAFVVYMSKTPKGRFIVTLTPTALDYSGTMDKTVAEINEAYEAGQEIWFEVGTESQGYAYIQANQISLGDRTYPSFEATLLNPNMGLLMYAYTEFTDDGTKQTYSTYLYTLTPAT